MADGTPALEAPAPLGHNGPPVELTPFDTIKIHIDDLLTEAHNWADGAKVENQDQADEVSRLIEDFRLAIAAADQKRVEEKRPLDEKIAEIQERYNALIADNKSQKGTAVVAMGALKATLKVYLDELAERQRQEAEAARLAAEAAAQAAADAARAADPTNLEEREEAEQLVTQARRAEFTARQAEAARPAAYGGARAMGLRKTFTAQITDEKACLLHYWTNNRAPLVAALQQLAQQDVSRHVRAIPGVKVVEGTKL